MKMGREYHCFGTIASLVLCSMILLATFLSMRIVLLSHNVDKRKAQLLL